LYFVISDNGRPMALLGGEAIQISNFEDESIAPCLMYLDLIKDMVTWFCFEFGKKLHSNSI